jgi:S-DNA-T family DNA segregation ATPase FtsK/SpoIIIE
MFIEIIRKGNVLEAVTDRNREEIHLPGFSCTIEREGDRAAVQAEADWRIRQSVFGSTQVFTLQKEGETIVLLCLKDPSCKRVYTGWKEPFVISGSFPGDLLYHHPLLEKMRLSLSRKDHTIRFENNTFVSFHHVIGKGVCTYENGEYLELFGSRIYLQEHFLMVLGTEYLSEEPETLSINSSMYKRHPHPSFARNRKPLLRLPDLKYEVKLPEPQRQMEENDASLFLSIGPSLMMGAASLSAGLLAMYRAWQEGRDLLDAVPMILLPGVMLVSALLWTPLQRASRKRKNRKKARHKEEAYLAMMHKGAESLQKKMEADLHLYEEIFPLKEDGLSLWIRHTRVRLGTCMPVSLLHVDQNWQRQEGTDLIQKEIHTLQEDETFQRRIPLIRDLSAYRCISLHIEDWKKMERIWIRRLLAGSDGHDFLLAMAQSIGISDEVLYCQNVFAQSGRRMILEKEEAGRMDLADQYEPHLFLFCKTWKGSLQKRNDVTVISQNNNADTDLLMEEEGDHAVLYDLSRNERVCFQMDEESGRIHLPAWVPETVVQNHDFASLHAADSVYDVDPVQLRRKHDINENLSAPVGYDATGHIIELDLNEKADGPHGLIAGTTGSGKSELILTYLCGLALNYSPDDVQFILIDFKGGGCVQSLQGKDFRLAHIAGTLCNLDISEMDRALIALRKECEKREQQFLKMHDLTGQPVRCIRDYRLARRDQTKMDPMADLVIVIDEFAQLKAERPEFMQDLIAIARIGRSLGIHLILSTQKPGGVINDQIRSNTSFKICLRVSDRQDSMEVLSCRDAYDLKQPGSFCLLTHHHLERGQGGYVHALAKSADIILFDRQLKQRKRKQKESGETQLAVLLQKLRQCDPVGAEQLWLPPLPLIPWSKELERGRQYGIGAVDDIHAETYRPLRLHPHAMLVISPDALEKKSFLQTVLCSLLTHCEKEDEIYLVDDLNTGLGPLIEKAGPVIAVLKSEEEEKRNALFHRILQESHPGTITLIVNDCSIFRENCAEGVTAFERIASHPLEYGVRLLLFGVSSAAVPYRLMSCFSMRLVLHDENLQDIAAIMERKASSLVKEHGCGILNNEHMDRFRWYETDRGDLQRAVGLVNRKVGRTKRFHLACLPDTVDSSLYQGAGMPLGIGKDSLQWVCKPQGLLYVTGINPKEYAAFARWYEQWRERHPVSEEVRFLPLSFYQKLEAEEKRKPVLFLGRGFENQYVLHGSVRHLKKGEGILFYGFGNEVLKVCEK